MTNKIIGALACCVIVLAVVAYVLWDGADVGAMSASNVAASDKINTPEPKPRSATEDKSALQSNDDTVPTGVTTEQKDQQNNEPDKKLCQLAQTYQDWYPKNNSYESAKFIEDVRAWAYARGYFQTEYSKGSVSIKKRSDYDYYDLENLQKMAEAGDSMANVRLAYRMYLQREEGSLEEAQPYCERAIVDGYTALTVCKSAYLVSQIRQGREKKEGEADPDKQRQLELEFQAWQNIPEALGDKLGSQIGQFMLGESEFEFEPEVVEQKTNAIVHTIKQRRAQLGIGEIEYPPAPELLVYVLENAESVREDINACFE